MAGNADILRTDMHKYRPLEYSSEEIRKLKILCGEYSNLIKDKNLLESQLYDVLSKYYPRIGLHGHESFMIMRDKMEKDIMRH